jgi:hypothetical protein
LSKYVGGRWRVQTLPIHPVVAGTYTSTILVNDFQKITLEGQVDIRSYDLAHIGKADGSPDRA